MPNPLMQQAVATVASASANPTGMAPAAPAQTPMTDPSTPFTLQLPAAGDFTMTVKPSLSLGTSPSTLGQNATANLAPAHDVDVMGGSAGYDREVKNYFMVREKRVANLAAKLDTETGKALRDQLAQKIAILQGAKEFQAADGATQAQMLDKAYQDAEASAITAGAVTADGAGASDTPDNTTSLGYTPQDLAALQAVASQYLVPYAQQAQASGGMAQASLQSLASQAATPQMRVYATQAANAQKAAQDQLAAAYMAQVSAAPTMAVIQQNTQLQQQMAQLQQQILGYQARSQQPSASTGADFASILAQAQAGGATTQAGG